MKRSMIIKCSLQTTAWLAMICISSHVYSQDKIEFYTTSAIPYHGKSIHAYFVDFADSLSGDILYQVRAGNGYPVSYHRKIRTSVCFDNKCRLLNIVVHWNITGRYLGFELPPGEYLSKAEHKPFTNEEYVRLHSLLSDPNSPLGTFSYNELAPAKTESNRDIDAVSSPTAKNLLEFVVEGAAYTTYKLWHIIHGVSREEVAKLTVEVLTPELFLEILRSAEVSDKIWALDHRHYMDETSHEIQKAILSFITSDEFSLAESAIQAVGKKDLEYENFQILLLKTLDAANYSLKKRIIEKFAEASEVSGPARLMLAEKLKAVSGELVTGTLDLFSAKNISDIAVCRQVATLLENQNVFISRQAYEFLKELSLTDREIQRKLKQYEIRHKPE